MLAASRCRGVTNSDNGDTEHHLQGGHTEHLNDGSGVQKPNTTNITGKISELEMNVSERDERLKQENLIIKER